MPICKERSSGPSVSRPPIESQEFAAPEIEGVDINDPEGNVPEELLIKGLNVIIDRWPNFPDKPGRKDRLKVAWLFKEELDWVYDELIYPVPPEKIVVKIEPSWLARSGVAYVYYQVYFEDVNLEQSLHRKLTIDASPENISPPEFPSANSEGYLNCSSDPPLWRGVDVWMRPDPGFDLGDFLICRWQGYLSLNASGPPIAETYKEVRKKIETQAELDCGVTVTIGPYIPHIKPMVDKASAHARCFLERNGEIIRKSGYGLVKIDRIIIGNGPCEPPEWL